MKLKFDVDSGLGAVLLCPQCGSTYLHHDKVEVFERGEDKGGLHIKVTDEVEINRDLRGNPSNRRHGLKVYFHCENCNAIPVLSIAQHKGSTCMDLNFTEEPEDGPEDLEYRCKLKAAIKSLQEMNKRKP